MIPTRNWARTAAFVVSASVVPTLGVAQDFIPGPQPNWDFAFRSEAVANDNAELNEDPLGTTSYWVNTLTLANRSETRTSRLAFDLSGHLRYLDTSTEDSEVRFDDPRLRLQYDRNVGDDSIGFLVFARRVDIIFFDTLRAESISGDLDFDDTRGTGSLENLGGRFFGTINEESPITLNYNFEAFQRRYFDTTDPDLDDHSRFRGDIGTLFDLTPTVRGALDLSYDYRDSENSRRTLRRNGTVSTGLNMAIDEINQLNFRIGYSRVTTEQRALDTEDIEEGVVGGISYSRLLLDGDVRAGFSSTIGENGQRDNLTVGRTWLRETSRFGGDIGVSATGLNDDVRPIGDFFFEQDLPRARIRANLSQDATLDDEAFDSVFTRLNLLFERDLSTVWSLNFRVDAARRFREDNEDNVTQRLNLEAGMQREINSYWSLNFGYRYAYRNSEENPEATSNSIFAALVRPLQIN